jgi:UDP-hydrolysing UDP-N-acetyl-D-glucosamine 2-epimerase
VRKVCVVVTARPSWSKLQTICEALRAMPDVELQIVACASALLERYGRVCDVIRAQGFTVNEEVYSIIEGESTLTGAQETGGLLNLLAPVLSRLRCDVVVGCADRHEVLGVAQAATYQHIPFGHLQGGERTGSIDDRVRDAITGLADIHFPSTELAAFRVYNMTGSSNVHWVGCPSIDVAKEAQDEPPVTVEELGGAGAPIDLGKPFSVLLQHPVTDEADQAYAQMAATLLGMSGVHLDAQILALFPGQDAGSEASSKAIREAQGWVHTVRNLPPNRFLRLLTQASVLVGNSSAGIREASFLGVPVVDIGNRQRGRQRAKNVVWAPHDAEQISQAIQRQIAHGRYASSDMYGNGTAGERIAEILASTEEKQPKGAIMIGVQRCL